jgi:hypothetical protein
MKESFLTSFVSVTSLEQRCKVTKPFPRIFSQDFDGPTVQKTELQSNVKDVESVAMMTSLESTTGVKGHLDRLLEQTKLVNMRTLPGFTEAGLEGEEFRETIESLENLCDVYSTEFRDMD